MMKKMKLIDYDTLLTFTTNLLTKVGLDDFSAEAVTHGLCEASLRGVDSHGINLLPHYVESALSGRKNPKPKFKILSTYPAFITIDADNAYGHAAGKKAMEIGAEIADKYGMCSVAVKNSSHAGALASTCLRAARKGYIVFGFTHADSLLLTHGGKTPFFGTNPICFCCPRENEEPFCLDMASTKISWNKLLNARLDDVHLDNNIAADENGNSVNDPNLATALFPIGGYKGYGIAAVVEILCSILTGMPYGKNIPSMFKAPMEEQRQLGQFYMILKTDAAVDKELFLSRLKELSNEVRLQPTKDETHAILPNDPEIKTSLERKKNGIPINDELLQRFKQLADQQKIAAPF